MFGYGICICIYNVEVIPGQVVYTVMIAIQVESAR